MVDLPTAAVGGGIGVAVADWPAGPFRGLLGRQLIATVENGAQPIDQFAYRDAKEEGEDGQLYLYYGGGGHLNVVRLAPDLRCCCLGPTGRRTRRSRRPATSRTASW